MKATHAVLCTGTVLENDMIATASVTSAPRGNGIGFDGHLRVGDQRGAFRSGGLRLNEKRSLVLNGKVASGDN